MRTIAIVNQKGGSGKTTTAISLSAALAAREQRTLLVDLDPQGHCGSGLAIPESRIDLQIGDAMVWPDRTPLASERFVWKMRTNLDVIPSTTKLAGLESPRGGLATREDRDMRLSRVLGALADQYDWCLIDCPPYIGLLTFNALRACDEVLIPVEAGYFALQGAGKQVSTIEALSRRFGCAIPYRIVPTMYDRSSKVGDDVLEAIRGRFSESLAPVVIRTDEMVREASSMGSPVIEYAPNAPSSKDYAALASHVMECEPARVSSDGSTGEGGIATATLTGGGDSGGSDAIDADDSHEKNESGGGWLRAGEMLSGTVSMDLGGEEESGGESARRHDEAGRGSTVSRAAELAAKARQLATRSEEISRKIHTDPDVARAMQRDAGRGTRDEATVRPGAYASAPTAPEGVRFGATAVEKGVWFVQPGEPEMVISVAGDHNGWVPSATRLKYNEARGVHEAFIVASPGAMRYRLVVNGEWIADPYNPNSQANPYGGRDSIVVVPGAGGGR